MYGYTEAACDDKGDKEGSKERPSKTPNKGEPAAIPVNSGDTILIMPPATSVSHQARRPIQFPPSPYHNAFAA